MSLRDLIKDAIEDLEDRVEDWDDVDDIIHEIADMYVPVYTYDLLQLACENLDLATLEPEMGPAFDGRPTAVNIIAANVYEAIEVALQIESTYEREVEK